MQLNNSLLPHIWISTSPNAFFHRLHHLRDTKFQMKSNKRFKCRCCPPHRGAWFEDFLFCWKELVDIGMWYQKVEHKVYIYILNILYSHFIKVYLPLLQFADPFCSVSLQCFVSSLEPKTNNSRVTKRIPLDAKLSTISKRLRKAACTHFCQPRHLHNSALSVSCLHSVMVLMCVYLYVDKYDSYLLMLKTTHLSILNET